MTRKPAAPAPETLTFLQRCLQNRWHAPALEEAQALARAPGWDWQAAVDAALRGRVAPLLYDTLKGVSWVPDTVLAKLHYAYFLTAARNLTMLRHLADLLKAFSAVGIQHMVLKGAVLGQAVYENVALRPMADLDILVRRVAATLGQKVAADTGYVLTKAPIRGEGKDDVSVKEVHLHQPSAPNETNIDLHWHLFSPPVSQEPRTPDWFWDTAVPTQVEQVDTLSLGREAQILYLSSHVGEQHAEGCSLGMEGTLLWLTDIATIVANCHTEIDWDLLARQAEAFDLTASTRTVLLYLGEQWSVPISSVSLEELRRLQVSAFKKRSLALMSARAPGGVSLHRTFFLRLANLRSKQAKAALLASYVFPSFRHLQQRYGVRQPILLPAFYLLHWYRGLRGFALSLWMYFREPSGGHRA